MLVQFSVWVFMLLPCFENLSVFSEISFLRAKKKKKKKKKAPPLKNPMFECQTCFIDLIIIYLFYYLPIN